MKKIKMLNLHTEECIDVPTDEVETILLERRCFNEGWWKGIMAGTVSVLTGLVIGELMVLNLKNKDEA